MNFFLIAFSSYKGTANCVKLQILASKLCEQARK